MSALLDAYRRMSVGKRVLIVVVVIIGLLYVWGSTLPQEQRPPATPGSTDLIRQECEAQYLDPALVNECVRRTHEQVQDDFDL